MDVRTGHITHFLLNRQKKTRPDNVLYVTDLTKDCLRNALFSITIRKEYDVDSLRVFESGNMIEDWWVKVLEAYPNVRVLGTQLPAYYLNGNLEVHGRVDVLCQHGNTSLVAQEVKSIKSTYYLGENPKEQHYKQLQFYLNCLNLEFGQIDYIDKTIMLTGGNVEDTPDICYVVERDIKPFIELLEKAKKLMKCIKDNEAPAEKGWLCDYCNYREECGE